MKSLVSLLLVFVNMAAFAFEITIDRGVDDLTRVAVIPFATRGDVADISGIIVSDLYNSGQFDTIDQHSLLSLPTAPSDLAFRDFRILQVEYVVMGEIIAISDRLIAKFHLVDIHSEQVITSAEVQGPGNGLRDVAHHVADHVYQEITGVPGVFSTKVLYVLIKNRATPDAEYWLMEADWDGFRAKGLVQSYQPLLSPTWSPDGTRVAFVWFETKEAAVYVLERGTKNLEKVADYEGINSAPAFSPDGKKLVMTLSRDGNAEIYVMTLETRTLKRITEHRAIDTEAEWSYDGEKLIFASDRSGSPQIYEVGLDGLAAKRLTFEGNYNTRPRMLPDGEHIVFVHRWQGEYHIAWQQLAPNAIPNILTSKVLDESPSLAPNGSMLMYSTRVQDESILAAVSIDGKVELRLPSEQGSVQEPAWSPFLKRITELREL